MRLVVVLSCVVLSALIGPALASAAPWTGTGSGTTTVTSDGTSGVAELTYDLHVSCCASGSWTFSTVANTNEAVPLQWTYTGFHAYFAVRAGLSAFVTHHSVTTTYPLVNAGPANCCSPPSAGFTYSGSTTLSVAAGDTYGFMITGSNFDSNGTLQGTLTVTVPKGSPPLPPRAGYCSAAGNTDPFTGAPIPAGTFLDLALGQPSVDANYTGALPAIFVDGKGISCDPPPAGYRQDGFAGNSQHVPDGVYVLYRPGP